VVHWLGHPLGTHSRLLLEVSVFAELVLLGIVMFFRVEAGHQHMKNSLKQFALVVNVVLFRAKIIMCGFVRTIYIILARIAMEIIQ
jgi:hypothetical protein